MNAVRAKVATGETTKARPIPKLQPGKALIFVGAKVNGVDTKALLDSGANQNLISVEEAARLGLKVAKEPGCMKAVDQPAKPLFGVAHEVLAKIIVAVERQPVQGGVLSAMQVAKGVKKGEETFLVAYKEEAKEGKTRRFWEQDGLIYTIGNRLFIPRWGNLRKELLKECHDSMWAGHPGMQRTMALISRSYYWPRMEEDVEGYVRTCLVCQQDKVEQRQPAGLLEPLPTPNAHGTV
ncbi:hypothetical protein GH714_043997 [Hevea brasiliensis]|uniref:Integrase zinc-binding domain-containing protein n=1 Tax=Hevea brasiliensis TaxID=3981 RepID=A0A6A6K4P1_HEVBR|nr:hypothetical protein GH714_043997 [Hevea brasiliensis]